MALVNPVTKISIRLPKPLPRHLKDDQVANLFSVITKARDRAMFMLMLRCGLRVEEVARLTVDAIDATCEEGKVYQIVSSIERLNGLPCWHGIVDQKVALAKFAVRQARKRGKRLAYRDMAIKTKRKIYKVYQTKD